MNIVYFDLETKYLADEVGGWDNIHRMELAVAVTYSTARGGFAHYTEDTVCALIEELSQADLVVGFNLLRFDYTVLRPYTTRDLHQLPTLDILRDLERKGASGETRLVRTGDAGRQQERRRHPVRAVVPRRAYRQGHPLLRAGCGHRAPAARVRTHAQAHLHYGRQAASPCEGELVGALMNP
jgi:hypothetical protein